MKWLILILTAPAVLLPKGAFAQNIDLTTQIESAGAAIYGSAGSAPSLAETIGTVISVLLSLLGVILLILMLYGGVLWMTAGGSDRVKKARAIFTNAFVGLLITMAAYAISQFVISSLGL